MISSSISVSCTIPSKRECCHRNNSSGGFASIALEDTTAVSSKAQNDIVVRTGCFFFLRRGRYSTRELAGGSHISL